MDRTSFYTVVEYEDGVRELDHLDNPLTNFEPKFEIGYYRVVQSDLLRPDIISNKVYGSVRFWWFIMLFNGISDIFNDLEEGTLLKIPNQIDMYEFFRSNRKR